MDAKTLSDLQFSKILDAASAYCRTSRGQELIRYKHMYMDPQACDAELALVEEGIYCFDLPNPPSLGGVEDMTFAFTAAAKGAVLSPSELIACAKMLSIGAETSHRLEAGRLRIPGLAALFNELKDLSSVAQRVFDTFDDEGRIRDDASPRLAEFRAKALLLGRRVKALIEEMAKSTKLEPILQDDYYTIREGRYVLPVKAEEHRFVPGIIHGSSQTGATLFIEPSQIVEDNNQLKVVLESIEVEERSIKADRSKLLGKYAEDARLLGEAMWRLDSILARSELAKRMEAHRPSIGTPADGLQLSSIKNPILFLLGRNVVPVSVELAGQHGRALVVSGPNAGGKSVTLSTVGLAVAMMRHGIFPAAMPGTVIPWYDQVFTVIGDPTSMEKSVSNFTGQLARLDQIITKVPEGRTLVLIDELATGTEPRKGEALATAIVEALVEKGAECIIATHFDQLKMMASSHPGVKNARVGLDKAGRPSYRLELGESGESNPFDVAAAVGFRKSILDRAKQLVGERERMLEEALANANKLNQELLEEKAETQELRKKLAADKKRYEQELIRLRNEADRLVYEARKEVLQKMKRLEDELEAIAKQAKAEKAGQVQGRRIEVTKKKREVQRDLLAEMAMVENHPTEQLPLADLKVGAKVWVAGLASEGTVMEVAADGRRATVQVGLLKTNVKLSDLRVPKPVSKKSQKSKPVPKKPGLDTETVKLTPVDEEDLPFVRSPDNTCDVRGMRLDEAITEVDRFLDMAFLNQVPEVMIIHGMGTSALLKGIRQYLKKSPYARRFRAGMVGEGGDGVTMVEVGGKV